MATFTNRLRCRECGKVLVPSPGGSRYATCPDWHGKLIPVSPADLEMLREEELKTIYPSLKRVKHGRYERGGTTFRRVRPLSPRGLPHKPKGGVAYCAELAKPWGEFQEIPDAS